MTPEQQAQALQDEYLVWLHAKWVADQKKLKSILEAWA